MSNKTKLIGEWRNPEPRERYIYHLNELIFFEDGTYTSNMDYVNGTYSVTDNILRLSTGYSSDYVYYFEINKNQLILTDTHETEEEPIQMTRVK